MKSHAFFSSVDWDDLLTNKAAIKPLFVPKAEASDDTTYFDPDRKFSMTRLTFMENDPNEIKNYQTRLSEEVAFDPFSHFC